LILGVQRAEAGSVGLADWCFNVNGSVDSSSVANNPSNACNGGTNSALASVNTSGWDSTAEPSNNTLGSVVITLTPGQNNNVAFYADYDVDFATLGSFDDFGTAHGSLPANWGYELDDPNTSNIFFDFAANTLANTNHVGTPSGLPNQCCDVAWALGIRNIFVPLGSSATVTFMVSTVQPTSGFYLQQTNQDTNNSIYLTANVPGTTTGSPEPSTLVLGLIAGAALVSWKYLQTSKSETRRI